jgi:hypothetical protein
VEQVIRRLASQRNRLSIFGENKVRFVFTIYEVQKELERVKHTYGWEEIREAIVLLNEVRLKIEALDERRAPFLSAPAFPVMGMRRGVEDDTETFVEFNPLIADAIRTLSFRQVDYNLLMDTRDPIGRWLLQRLHLLMAETREPIQLMSASEIRSNSGMPTWKKTRDLLRRVTTAVELLRQQGILSEVHLEDKMVGKRKDDIIYTMVSSDSFFAQTQRSRQQAEDNKADFALASKGRTPTEFVPISGVDTFRLRDKRSRRNLTVVATQTAP